MPNVLELRRPLNQEGSQDVELTAVRETPEGVQNVNVEVITSKWKDQALFGGLMLALGVPSLTVFFVVSNQWMESPSQRGWLILGFGFYIITALK